MAGLSFLIHPSELSVLLALDTATDFAAIALHDGEQVLGEVNWRSQRRHTEELAPQVYALLRLLALTPADLTALAVAIGPGSYTGTRVALSFAKGIVAATGVALIGIPSLDILAFPHLHPRLPLCALVAAGRGRYNWASYAAGTDVPQRQSEWGLLRLPPLLARLAPPMRFVGELSPADCSHLLAAWGEAASVVPAGLAVRRAGVLAELAWRRLRAGDVDDPARLSPIYVST